MANPLRENLKINRYDSKGNIQIYTIGRNKSTIILWGYNKRYPVAKLENVDTAAFFTYWNAYPAGQTTFDNALTATSIRSMAQNIRTEFPNAFITSYTYKSGVGIASITDANGQHTYYEYDFGNRLQQIKDHNGNILQAYQYKYLGAD